MLMNLRGLKMLKIKIEYQIILNLELRELEIYKKRDLKKKTPIDGILKSWNK